MTYASVLGTPLWENIITGVKAAVDSGSNTNELGTAILDFMERAARGVDMVRSYAQQLSEEQFFSILDHHQIETLDAVPTFTVLTDLVKSLMTAVEQGQSVAA
jgi:N-acetylglutamate synthase-like GNAT family acetyltransferase